MAITLAGTFEDQTAAQEAIERLRAAGIATSDISMIVRDREAVAPGGAEAGIRGGTVAATAPNPMLRGEEPVLRTAVEDDEVVAMTPEDLSVTASGTTTGGIIGAIGGLLVGLGALALPGLGPIVAAGPLAATLGGAAIGAATGGLIGALVDAGVPEEYATTYATHVERGHVLLTVHPRPEQQDRVRDILAHAGALNIYPTTTILV